MNRLTSSIIQSLFVENYGKNWVFSPASYLEAMGSLAVCVKDKNLSELTDVAPNILRPQADGLDTYNCLLYAEEYRSALVESVTQTLAARGGDLKSFIGPEVADTVNAIVSEKTHGKISNLLSRDDIGEFVKFIILNCVYFKQTWLHEFDDSWMEQPFYGAARIAQVKYLTRHVVGQRYYEDSVVDIVEIPYKESDVCCYLVVPKTGLFEVFNHIGAVIQNLQLVQSGFDVHVTVPPFKTESTIPLASLTSTAGVKSIFEHTKDWSLIDFTKLDPAALMWVSAIIQKAYIDFTKVGTEAAAATAVLLSVTGCYMGDWSMPLRIKYVRADKPFLYVLARRSDPTHPLFIGVVNDLPSSS